jgi:hypothetical protein
VYVYYIVHNDKESVKLNNNAGACLICSKIYNSTIIKASNQDKAYITAILGKSKRTHYLDISVFELCSYILHG